MQRLVVGPCIAYCLRFRVASVDVVVPAPAILCFAPLSVVTALFCDPASSDVLRQLEAVTIDRGAKQT